MVSAEVREAPRPMSDRQRTHMLLDHVLRYRAALMALWWEHGTDLPFEAWVEIHAIRGSQGR